VKGGGQIRVCVLVGIGEGGVPATNQMAMRELCRVVLNNARDGNADAWNASRGYDHVYGQGKLVYGTRDFKSLEDELGEQGIWVEEVSILLGNPCNI